MPGNVRKTLDQRLKYFEYKDRGYSSKSAAEKAGVSTGTGFRWNVEWRDRAETVKAATDRAEAKVGGPKDYDQLGPEAMRAWNDFGYFEERYYGVISHPWQTEAAEQIREYLETPDKEYLVVNAPPGAGKSTLMTQRIPSWLTVRDRQIRGMIGSATTRLAKYNVSQLRREFARVHPIQNPTEEVAKGLAFDAVATLSQDFGRFKPAERDLWAADAFTVEQASAKGPLSEKEPTWSAYGIDAEYTGLRYPFVMWDDLVSLSNQSTPEMREKIERLWMSVCENRLEPGGLLVLMGQRLLPSDLYRFALDMQIPTEDEDEVDDVIDPEVVIPMVPKYHHLCYRAHYEDKCQPGTHKRGAPAWPKGCLLVPERLTYRDIRIAEAKPDYRTVYQQEDVNPDMVLVQREWIWGDDAHTGCLDKFRDQWEMPERTDGEFLMVLSADPSPSNFWGVILWAYHPESEQRFVIAIWRRRMDAPDFLDFNTNDGTYSGLLEEWWQESSQMGHPFTHLIFEANAGNKWLTQSSDFRRWKDRRSVELILHTTGRNKADPDFGVQTIAPHYKFGRVRLPYKEGGVGRARTLDLVKEVTTYPGGKTDDLVMAHWFFENRLSDIYLPARPNLRALRPSWIKSTRPKWIRNPARMPA